MLIIGEITSLLLEYVDYQERIELICCCKYLYHNWMKKFLRNLRFRKWKYELTTDEFSQRINNTISNPFNRLDLFLDKDALPNGLNRFLSIMNNCLHELECSRNIFLEIMSSTERLKVKKLVLQFNLSDKFDLTRDIHDNISKIIDCEAISLRFSSRNPGNCSLLPYISSLQSLLLSGAVLNPSLFLNYANTLRHLHLRNCSISDVSMLGNILNLELKYCNNIIDISALNSNDHIVIENCEKIQDYSRSFSNSRKIEIFFIENRNYCFDLTRWTKVVDLKLITSIYDGNFNYKENNKLPKSVKCLFLSGAFVSSIDFTVTADHALNEIKLSTDGSITSLEGYGLERVAIIECDNLISLQSLQGLGSGRNRKITACEKITDFSLLNSLPIVKIQYCKGFNDPLQVRMVRDLTIVPIRDICFKSDPILNNNYESIHSLTLSNTKYVKDFDGLAKIPHLQLDRCGCYWIDQFLRAEKRPANQRVVLHCSNHGAVLSEELLDIHNQYMKDHYDFYDHQSQLPKKWIWVRKS